MGQRIEKRLREQLTERDDNAKLGSGRGDLIGHFSRLRRRPHRHAELDSRALHRRGIRTRTARSAAIRLGNDERDIVTGINQGA
jgi:hypothetical protein